MSRPSSILISGLLLGMFAIGVLLSAEPSKQQNREPSTASAERTRKTMRMLDDVYKTAVVLITDKNVNDENDFPAGSAAIALFGAVEKKAGTEFDYCT